MAPFDIVKRHKALYAPSAKHPAVVDVPELAFLMVDGRGDPQTAEHYHQALEALYSVAYTLKFTLKKADPDRDFKVAPLEGQWWADTEAPSMEDLLTTRDDWNWTMMIAQPDIVTAELVERSRAEAIRKKGLPALKEIRFERCEEGLSAQILYFGPYALEGPTIARLHQFIAEQCCALYGKHHEIYMNDARRTAPEKLKTIIRQPCRRATG